VRTHKVAPYSSTVGDKMKIHIGYTRVIVILTSAALVSAANYEITFHKAHF